MCLSGLGISPVNTEESTGLDSLSAGVLVDEVASSIQMKAWWFNLEKNWSLTPDGTTGFLSVPADVSEMLAYGASAGSQLTIRSNRVYDRFKHTYDLREATLDDDTILFQFQLVLPFEDMPEAARWYVAYRAKRIYAENNEGDERQVIRMERTELEQLAKLETLDLKHKNSNMFGSGRAGTVMGRIGGANASAWMPNAVRINE